MVVADPLEELELADKHRLQPTRIPGQIANRVI